MLTSLDAANVHKAWLNAQVWTETFEAEIPMDTLQPPSEPGYYLDALRCVILPREDEYTRRDRDINVQCDYQIDTFLAAHAKAMTPERIYNQAHKIVLKLLQTPNALAGGFIVGVRRTIWLPDKLQGERIFGTVITVDLSCDEQMEIE